MSEPRPYAEIAREAANECSALTYGVYRVGSRETATRFEPIVEAACVRAVDQDRAARAAMVDTSAQDAIDYKSDVERLRDVLEWVRIQFEYGTDGRAKDVVARIDAALAEAPPPQGHSPRSETEGASPFKCKSGRHTWDNADDAVKCCNGWKRVLVMGRGDNQQLIEGVMVGREWRNNIAKGRQWTHV